MKLAQLSCSPKRPAADWVACWEHPLEEGGEGVLAEFASLAAFREENAKLYIAVFMSLDAGEEGVSPKSACPSAAEAVPLVPMYVLFDEGDAGVLARAAFTSVFEVENAIL